MNLIQFLMPDGARAVALREGGLVRRLSGVGSVYDMVSQAFASGQPLTGVIAGMTRGEAVDLRRVALDGRLLAPIDHPDPAHLQLTGTGLTHTGSAATRDAMHKTLESNAETLSDTMKMFRLGLEGGKPGKGSDGVQPEWFWKGTGHAVVRPGHPMLSPSFALDAGEEPEIAGIYVIAPDGMPHRLGFALANEFSDHVMERQNYLYLSHSKLRPCAFGPELVIGDLAADVRGMSRLYRDGAVLWEKEFLSGEDNMTHTIANLERHHFKYPQFRQPGDVHVHMFGTATLSFADGVVTQDGDVMELELGGFGLPLRNPIRMETSSPLPEVAALYA